VIFFFLSNLIQFYFNILFSLFVSPFALSYQLYIILILWNLWEKKETWSYWVRNTTYVAIAKPTKKFLIDEMIVIHAFSFLFFHSTLFPTRVYQRKVESSISLIQEKPDILGSSQFINCLPCGVARCWLAKSTTKPPILQMIARYYFSKF